MGNHQKAFPTTFTACLGIVILPLLSLPIEANQDIQFWAFSYFVLPVLPVQ